MAKKCTSIPSIRIGTPSSDDKGERLHSGERSRGGVVVKRVRCRGMKKGGISFVREDSFEAISVGSVNGKNERPCFPPKKKKDCRSLQREGYRVRFAVGGEP